MTTYTTTTDENGNFTITLDTPLTNGEVVKVTAEKDGESKSINIQAPSEFYLPPSSGSESGGNGTTHKHLLHAAYIRAVLSGEKIVHDGSNAIIETEGNTQTITNTYFKKYEPIRIYQAHPIDLDYFKSLADEDNVVKFRQGSVYQNGTISWNGDGFWFTKSDLLNKLQNVSGISIDQNCIYLILGNSIYHQTSGDFDTESNYIYEITYKDQVYTYRLNKNYVESN